MPCAPTFVSSPVYLFTGSVSSLDFHDSIILHACVHSFTRPFSNAAVVCVYVLGTHREKAWLLPFRKLTAEKRRVIYVNEIIPLSFSHCFPAEEGKASSVFSRQQKESRQAS